MENVLLIINQFYHSSTINRMEGSERFEISYRSETKFNMFNVSRIGIDM